MWGSAGAESPVNCREPGGVWGILEVSGWDEEFPSPPGGRQLAKIPLLVIDLPASADAFAKGIINPLDGAFGVPVADIGDRKSVV